MYYDLDDAPWCFATWKALTGVHHGLFPKDNNQLPISWSHQTANKISSFFDQFCACNTEEEKISFSSVKKNGSNVPGATG
jgi:TATA-binding protein-associated factor